MSFFTCVKQERGDFCSLLSVCLLLLNVKEKELYVTGSYEVQTNENVGSRRFSFPIEGETKVNNLRKTTIICVFF